MQITDGNGTNYGAKVDTEHRLRTYGVIETDFLHTNEAGNAYIWDFPGYDYDAADTVMFIRNDGDDSLHIHHIYLYCDTASKVQFHFPANPTVAGTLVTGVNPNRGSGKVADATAYQDETGNTQGTVFASEYIAANGVITTFKEEGFEIILSKNACLGVDIVTAGTMAYGHIVGYFHTES